MVSNHLLNGMILQVGQTARKQHAILKIWGRTMTATPWKEGAREDRCGIRFEDCCICFSVGKNFVKARNHTLKTLAWNDKSLDLSSIFLVSRAVVMVDRDSWMAHISLWEVKFLNLLVRRTLPAKAAFAKDVYHDIGISKGRMKETLFKSILCIMILLDESPCT